MDSYRSCKLRVVELCAGGPIGFAASLDRLLPFRNTPQVPASRLCGRYGRGPWQTARQFVAILALVSG